MLDPNRRRASRANSAYRWDFELERIERRLLLSSNVDRPFTTTEIVVAFEGNRGIPALTEKLNAAPAIRQLVDVNRSTNMFTVRGATLVTVKLRAGVDPLNVTNRFKSLTGVRWAQPNYVYSDIDPRDFTPNDPQYASQYHHPLMKNNLAWDTTLGISSVKIGVTDDGVLLNHPDLAGNIWVNPGEVAGNGIDDDGNGKIDDVNGWDVWANDNNPNPDTTGSDHGTHVAGIFSARTNNAVGVSGTAGGATIVPIRFYNGSWTSTIVANAYAYAVTAGCKIVNTSYNVDGFSSDAIFAAGLDFMFDAGILHFNSAGNNGQLNPPRQKWDQSLFVVNTTSTDARSSSSNYGWGVDISAPGTNILSTAIGTAFAATYELKSGTSMSTPNAAGAAALIWSAHPTWTREQVAAQLIATADNIDAANPTFIGLLGSGRVNTFRGVTESIAPPKMKATPLIGLPVEGGSTATKPTSFTLDIANVFDPSTMTSSAFELRGDGPDDAFNTSDDTLVPFTLRFGSNNNIDYMLGCNRLFFSGLGAMPADRYRFSGLATLTDPFGQALDGNGNGTGGDAFTRTFILNGPSVSTSAFLFETTPHRFSFTFNQNVSASLSVADLVLENLTTSQTIPSGDLALLSYDVPTNTATFRYTGSGGGLPDVLADGNYRATLVGSGISNVSGVTMLNYELNFAFLQGDANRDGIVNVNDFTILASNFGQTGRVFSQGDFNYDTIVNVNDFTILASRFGATLAPPSASSLFGGERIGDDSPLEQLA